MFGNVSLLRNAISVSTAVVSFLTVRIHRQGFSSARPAGARCDGADTYVRVFLCAQM